MKVKSEMTVKVYCLEPGQSLQDAHKLMQQHNCRHVPVVEEGAVVGILSDRDILLFASRKEGAQDIEVPDVLVSEAMSREVLSCRPEQRISDVAKIMVKEKLDSLPVIGEDDKLVGLITTTDLLGLLSQQAGQEDSLSTIPFSINTLEDFDF